MGKKNILIFCIAIALISLPRIAVAAPVVCADGSQAPTTSQCPTAATSATLQHFNPGITATGGGGDTFSGLNFSGVGGAVLSCTNIGETAAGTVSDLFKSAQQRADAAGKAAIDSIDLDLAGPEQPVTDKKATEQLKKQTQRENCLNAVAYAVSKNMLQQVTSRTLNWINTGLSGNPLYVRDTDSFLKNIRDDKINSFLQAVPNSDPIFGNALRSAITQQVTGYTDGRIDQVMNTPEGRSYQSFQEDFTQGGWTAFLNPKNNALSAYYNAVDSVTSQIGKAQQNVKDELVQGNGFLSMKKCAEWSDGINQTAVKTDCTSQYADQKKAELTVCSEKTAILKDSCIQSVNTKYNTLTESCVATTSNVEGAVASCLRYETVTPGSVIAAQAATVTTTNVRQLEQADQINEVLGSFFDQLLTKLFSDGLGGLTGSGIAMGGTNVVLDSNGMPIQSVNLTSAEKAFGYQSINGGFNGEFDISRPQQLRAIIKTQIDFINRTKDSQMAMSRIIPTLGKLDYCVPGPNPSWKVGTDYNTELILSSLAGKPPSRALGNTISTISGAAAAIPGPGAVIAAVGSLVGAIANIGGGNEPASVETKSLQLFDKVTNGGRKISDFYIERSSGFLSFDDIPLIDYLQLGYNDLISYYNASYAPTIITGVLEAADRTNPRTYATARVAEVLNETNNLVYYNQNIAAFEKENSNNISATEDAISKLTAINEEMEKIVNTAKKRYIKNNPTVNMACLNNAYNVAINADGSVPEVGGTVVIPATGATRFETDIIDPMVIQSKNARTYFYNHL